MWKDFKEFAMRGNAIDLAVAVVIGAAFGKIVSSLVDDIIMPLIGVLTGGINFSESFAFGSGDAQVKIGAFLQSIIDFTLIAFAIFIAIRLMNKLSRKKKRRL